MSSLEDRRSWRQPSSVLKSADLVLVLLWSFCGLALQLALLAQTASFIPAWTT